MRILPRFRTFQFCPKDARLRWADDDAAIPVIDAAPNLGAIAMPMSAELPVHTPAADRRNQIDWTWNDVLKTSGTSVVVALVALFVVILVAASVTLPSSPLDTPTPVSTEFLIGP